MAKTLAQTIKRFKDKIIINPETDCHIWQGAIRGKYGLFRFNNKIQSAHRVAYIIKNGDIPENMVIRHICDNPLCCNPDHLIIGTYQDNYNDRTKRGLFNKKLTGEQVRYIFNTSIDIKELSLKYGVSIDTIRRIKQGKAWRDYLLS